MINLSRKPKVVMILQARMGSTRLPGKSMIDLAGAPLIGRIIDRVRRCKRVDEIVLATTQKPEDDVLEELARSYGISVFRGSENDLVDRYYQAAKAFNADVVVRFPADNPVPEPSEIDCIIAYHLAGQSDFSSNLAEVYGNGYPNGIGAEVFNFEILEEVWQTSSDPRKREHPHLNFFDYESQKPANPHRYRVGTVQCPPEFRRPDLVLDVNTREEYEFMAELYRYLYPRNPQFHITDIIEWYDNAYLPGRQNMIKNINSKDYHDYVIKARAFHAPTKLIWDCQAESALEDIFKKERWKEIGVVIDVNLLNIPVFESILFKLKELSKKVAIFKQDVSEPDTDYADTAASVFREDPPEVMVGIGGGSTLDVAKAVSVLLTNEKDAASYQGFMLVEKPGLPSVMIPTTAGTGSEVTWTAVFTNHKKMLKAGINSPYLFPKYAILDARLTVSMPKHVTVSTGMDALAHSIESFSAKSATIVSRMVSKQAFYVLYWNFLAVIKDGSDLEARKQMQLGSALAGWAIVNAGTGPCHSIAYALGTYFKVPHGTANAMLLPKVMRLNEDKRQGLYAPLWDVVHPEDTHLAGSVRSRRLIATLEQVLDEAEFKTSLSSFGVSSEDIDFLAAKGLELKSALQNNPVEFGFEDSRAALKLIV